MFPHDMSIEPSRLVNTFVMLRGCSSAPTVMTFLAVAGDRMVSATPPKPSLSPPPELPAENTNSTGCEPVTVGNASRTAAS